MIHKLSLQKKYFDLISRGLKTIELRLFDEKRRKIKVGNLIHFYPNGDEENILNAKVVHLYKAENFEKLLKQINFEDVGFNSAEELVGTMIEFYSIDRQEKFGVVGIGIEVL